MARTRREDTSPADLAPAKPRRPDAKAFAEIAARSKSFRPARETLRRVRAVPTIFPDVDRATHVGGWPIDRIAVVHGPSAAGKALAEDSPVLTPGGWREIGSLTLADRVIGADGRAHRVLGVYEQGVKQLYRVTFSDGASVECCDEHLWWTSTANERMRGKFARGPRPGRKRIPTGSEGRGSAKSLSEIRDGFRPRDHQVPIVAPVEFRHSQDAPLLHPYLLGLLLGDGSFRMTSVTFSKPEEDLWIALRSCLPLGDFAKEMPNGSGVRIVAGSRRVSRGSSTSRALRELGLSGCTSLTKFIPHRFMRASVEDRWALLRGLLDTDGSVEHGGRRVEFSSSSPRLAANVAELARSLGALVREDPPRVTSYSYRGEDRQGAPSTRLSIAFPDGVIPISSRKHLARWRGRRGVPLRRLMVSIEPTREMRAVCIAVDSPDHLYVTAGYIVTHNTLFAHGLGLSFLKRGHMYCLLDVEQTTPQPWMETLFAEHADNPGFIASRPKTYEQAVNDVRKVAEGLAEAREKGKLPPDTTALFVVDSIRKLVPEDIQARIKKLGAEGEKGSVDGFSGAAGRMRAALNAAWLDELVPLMGHTGCAMLFVGRESDDPTADAKDRQFGNDWKLTGGRALYFDSSMVVRVSRASMVYEGEGDNKIVVGEKHQVEIHKTKVSARQDQRERAVFFTSNGAKYPEGFDRARDVYHLADELGAWKKAGSWRSFGRQRWQSEARFVASVEPDVLDAIEAACREKFGDLSRERADIVGGA
jgi:RecA/RadA recombinase